MTHAAPREDEVGELLERGLALGDDLEVRLVRYGLVRRLHEHAACDALQVKRAVHAPMLELHRVRHREDLEVLALLQERERIGFVGRRDDRLAEGVLHRLRQFLRHRPVRADDAAERGHGVADERALVRAGDVELRRDAAGVLVLHDRHGRLREVGRDLPRGVDVEDVVERRRLPVDLLRSDHRALFLAAQRVERRLLVRVLAVAEVAHLPQRERHLVGK